MSLFSLKKQTNRKNNAGQMQKISKYKNKRKYNENSCFDQPQTYG